MFCFIQQNILFSVHAQEFHLPSYSDEGTSSSHVAASQSIPNAPHASLSYSQPQSRLGHQEPTTQNRKNSSISVNQLSNNLANMTVLNRPSSSNSQQQHQQQPQNSNNKSHSSRREAVSPPKKTEESSSSSVLVTNAANRHNSSNKKKAAVGPVQLPASNWADAPEFVPRNFEPPPKPGIYLAYSVCHNFVNSFFFPLWKRKRKVVKFLSFFFLRTSSRYGLLNA